MTEYLFHQRVPLLPTAPSTLLPLSELRHHDRDAFQRAWAKYDDTPERQRLREVIVPLIEKRWTEVVFLSPVHPHAIWRAWLELTGHELPSEDFWAIPATTVARSTAVVYDQSPDAVTGEPIRPTDVTWFDPGTYVALAHAPAANREWLGRLYAQGKRGAWWHRTPHVLVGARVDLEGAEVVDWARPS